MRRPTFPSLRFATLLSVLTFPACFSLPHVDPGNRVIADFEGDAGLSPTWDVFGPWTCSAYVDPSQPREGGQDGGLAGGDIDAGQALTCTPDLGPGSPDPSAPANVVPHALVARFNLTTPDQPFDVDVATATKSGPVNLTGFSQFLFEAKLGSTMRGTASLPAGTELKVELRCSSTNPYDPLVNQDFTISLEATSAKPIILPLSSFMGPSQRQTCLAAVDGIGFVVVPGSAQAGTQIAGTLQLENVELK